MLNDVGPSAFSKCDSLKQIAFLEGRAALRTKSNSNVWNRLFLESRVRELILPSTLKEISPDIFNDY